MENTIGMVSRNRCLENTNLSFEGAEYSKTDFLINQISFFHVTDLERIKVKNQNLRWSSELSKLAKVPPMISHSWVYMFPWGYMYPQEYMYP